MTAFLTSTVGLAVLAAAGVTALGVLWRKALRPIYRGFKKAHLTVDRILDAVEVVESQTRQLTTNGGSHVADDVKETRRLVEAQAVAAAEVKEALEAEQRAVREALEEHRVSVNAELKDVWRSLATRDIHQTAEHLTVVADRAERAADRSPEAT